MTGKTVMLDHEGCEMCRGTGTIMHLRLGDPKDKVLWTCPRCVGQAGFAFVRADDGWKLGHKDV